MQKLGLLGMKTLDQFKSLAGSASGTAKTLSISSRTSSDSITMGSFANLKLTAEKLVKEQASVRTDLDTANSKLKKSVEHIHTLEEKLQSVLNENAKLKVKQKEDDKLWQGLESKLSSTKTLCDQLTDTLQLLARQVQDAEKDKQLIEEKLTTNSAALDNLSAQMNNLSIKLDSAEEIIRERDQMLKELKLQKEENDAFYENEYSKTAKLTEEKDALIKCLEADVISNKLASEKLNACLEGANMELKLKEDDLLRLRDALGEMERERNDLQSSNDEFVQKLSASLHEINNLKVAVDGFASEVIELDKQSVSVSEKMAQLCSVYESCLKLAEHERDLSARRAQHQYDLLYSQHILMKSEKDELQSVNQGLLNKVYELQREQESSMVQNAEECCLAEERIRKLESEAEILASKKSEAEKSVVKLEEQVANLLDNLRSSEMDKNDLLLKFSELELEKNEIIGKAQADIHKKEDEMDEFQKEIVKLNHQVQSLEEQVSKLDVTLVEREQLIIQFKDKQRDLDNKKTEIEGLLVTAESKLSEAKKQFDAMLESKQSELSRHLKEISLRNDQAINEIRKKYEIEKQEIIDAEKEKADKIVAEKESEYKQRLDQCKEESRKQLAHIQEEHTIMIVHLQKEHVKRELNLKSDHLEEVKRFQLQAESELREKTIMLRDEHESQTRELRLQNEDACRQIQQELDLQKAKEERQRALLQLQWKVMDDKPREDQEVNSKKDYSVSSIRMRDPDGMKTNTHAQDMPYQGAILSPVSSLLKKVEKANSGNIMDISKHGRKVTHREYEVETTNGGTVTKRRKTKSTVMFADPRKHKKVATPKGSAPRSSTKGTRTKGYSQPPSNIGDLFSEGSLNPYADGDDPYAFD